MKILYGFTETNKFLKRITGRISDEEYAELQFYICENPDEGDLIQGSGGLRKIRWHVGGKGKSGGVRVIYFHAVNLEKILMLDIYKKSEKSNMSKAEITALRQTLKDWKR
ncbi:MAG: type II toxin-antitoxin system RelE/ParE family toxin [Pyrinomonadaceae bacterium]|nr:type II toxin-antitoxin system RelE/ParE family toxin [Pyrinomonadaceae bacterium]